MSELYMSLTNNLSCIAHKYDLILETSLIKYEIGSISTA